MPRKPRILVPGAVYHVYNRISSGERVFEDEKVAGELIELIRDAANRDGWSVLAWCVMANHYHLVVRSGGVPLSRGLHWIQNIFSRRFNRREGRTGPLWQSRYHAKVVEDEKYLWQLILYVHLNPVRARLVRAPGEYPNTGHREMLKRSTTALLDRDQALLCFAPDRRSALRQYRAAIETAVDRAPIAGQIQEGSAGDMGVEAAGELWFDPEVVYVDELGWSAARPRPEVSAETFVESACEALDVDPMVIGSESRRSTVVRQRRLIMALGVERWGLRSGLLALAIGRSPERVSVWVGQGAALRQEDVAFQTEYERVDAALLERLVEVTKSDGMK